MKSILAKKHYILKDSRIYIVLTIGAWVSLLLLHLLLFCLGYCNPAFFFLWCGFFVLAVDYDLLRPEEVHWREFFLFGGFALIMIFITGYDWYSG